MGPLDKAVEQGRFADVGPADYGDDGDWQINSLSFIFDYASARVGRVPNESLG
jgi:hypothetical protein